MPLFIDSGFSFSSGWHHKYSKSRYLEDVYFDLEKKLDQARKEVATCHTQYPEIFPKPSGNVNPSLGVGLATIPQCWGAKIKYDVDMYPIALPIVDDNTDILSLRAPNLDDTAQWLMEQIDIYVDMGYNKRQISLPDLQGPLNVAMRLINDNRFMSLVARARLGKNEKYDKIVQHVLDICTECYIDIKKKLCAGTDRNIRGKWSVSGCTYYYLRPDQWEYYIIPVIEKCKESLGQDVNLHHCGTADSERVLSYHKVGWVSCEFGFPSDLKTVRKNYINKKVGPVPISCRVSPYRLLNQTSEQIKEDVNWIIDQIQGGPARISCVGIPRDTPRENVMAMWDTIQDFHKRKEQEMEDLE